MSSLKDKVMEIANLITEGKGRDAFEKFYHDEVVMQENQDTPTIGKEANREREKGFYDAVESFIAEPLKIGVGDNFTLVEWKLKYAFKGSAPVEHRQVSMQEWQDDKIIKEVFYHQPKF
jgi:hypothetical protein